MRADATAAPALERHYERMVGERRLKDGRQLAQALGLQRGQRVLELGCGTGALSQHLADCVGVDGEVLGLDTLPLRVQMAHQQGRHNLRFQVGGPYQLERFGAGGFDVIVANGVLHTWPDAAAAVAACARLLAPGGRLGLVTPCADHPHPARRVRDAVLQEVPYRSYLPPVAAREYTVNANQLESLLGAAGLVAVQVQAEPETLNHATAQGAVEFMHASAWGHFLAHLPPALRTAARALIEQRLETLRTPAGIVCHTVRLLACASAARTP